MKRNRIKLTDGASLLVHVTGDRIGDALVKWPAIAGIKQAMPGLRLIWVAGRRPSVFNGVLASIAAGVIDEVHDCAGVGIHWRELMHAAPFGPMDVVIATEPKLRDAVLLKRTPHQRFISPAANFWLSDCKLPPGERYPRSVTAQIKRLFELAIGQPIALDNQIPLSAELRASAAAALPSGPSYVGLSPGAGGKRKRWPLPSFIEVAKALASSGRTPVFFLGPEEVGMSGEISAAVPGAVMPELNEDNTAPGTPLFTIALAERLAVGVANDSGGGHLLAAGRRPIISLYGHTDPEKFHTPYGRRVAINAGQFGGQEMSRIPVHAVLEQINAFCPPID